MTFENEMDAMFANICDSEELVKGMMFKTKDDLIEAIKAFHILQLSG